MRACCGYDAIETQPNRRLLGATAITTASSVAWLQRSVVSQRRTSTGLGNSYLGEQNSEQWRDVQVSCGANQSRY